MFRAEKLSSMNTPGKYWERNIHEQSSGAASVTWGWTES